VQILRYIPTGKEAGRVQELSYHYYHSEKWHKKRGVISDPPLIFNCRPELVLSICYTNRLTEKDCLIN